MQLALGEIVGQSLSEPREEQHHKTACDREDPHAPEIASRAVGQPRRARRVLRRDWRTGARMGAGSRSGSKRTLAAAGLRPRGFTRSGPVGKRGRDRTGLRGDGRGRTQVRARGALEAEFQQSERSGLGACTCLRALAAEHTSTIARHAVLLPGTADAVPLRVLRIGTRRDLRSIRIATRQQLLSVAQIDHLIGARRAGAQLIPPSHRVLADVAPRLFQALRPG